jgi:hypothetical protein
MCSAITKIYDKELYEHPTEKNNDKLKSIGFGTNEARKKLVY